MRNIPEQINDISWYYRGFAIVQKEPSNFLITKISVYYFMADSLVKARNKIDEWHLSNKASMNYGTVIIQDGVYVPSHGSPTDSQRRSPVRFAGQVEAISPRLEPKAGLKTFVVNLHYSDNRVVYSGGKALSTDFKVDYSKQFTRIASDRNPVKETKAFVAQFAGCAEASKLRKRIIALSRIHNSISNETLRFGVS